MLVVENSLSASLVCAITVQTEIIKANFLIYPMFKHKIESENPARKTGNIACGSSLYRAGM